MVVEMTSFPKKIAFGRQKMWRWLQRYGGYVAAAGGQIMGYIICSITMKGGLRHCRIVSIAVHPAYQGVGLGRRLMHRAMRDLKRRGALAYDLYVQTSSAAAIALYCQLGFRIIRTIRGHYADGSDAFSMRKSV